MCIRDADFPCYGVRMKKLLFITGTRADYGKIKPLIRAVEKEDGFEAFIYVSGMHLISRFGDTYMEVLKDGYKNVYVDFAQANLGIMSYDLGNVICNLTGYVRRIEPDLIIVHGDRIDAMAGAIVGALNNIRVAHIEGGELSGTIDESMRHAITKFAHLHLVCNDDARGRLIQLGEDEKRIFVIGSPDIDVMLSENLPTLDQIRERYRFDYDHYAIMMYHPVTTELSGLQKRFREVLKALIDSGKNYVVIYPNNDQGSEIIWNEYENLRENDHFRMYPSLRFEYFLGMLKNADFMIGNSSAGVRETGVYGIPAIDIGTRQRGRYSTANSNIQHVDENCSDILNAINRVDQYRITVYSFGRGDSTKRFMEILRNPDMWKTGLQKRFVELTGRSTL